MRIYLVNNNIVYVQGTDAKINDFAPSGKMDGVDLYADNAAEQLREYFKNHEINDFWGMYGDEIPTAEIADEMENAVLVYSDEQTL